MITEIILDWYDSNKVVIELNAAGLSHADSLLQPTGAEANCLNWVVGHVIANRNTALGLLNWPLVWPDELIARYQTGSLPVGPDDEGAVEFAELLHDLGRTQKALAAALAQATPDLLDAPYSQRQTIGQRLMGLAWHEAYHAGQTDYLRRLAGKPDGGVR
ncbi:MAG: DinB family protein [Caldilineales bacterium]|nr:DinB family protein [Caldilineales bacterium]